MVFQLGPKPPLFSLESRQRSASERLAGGLGEGSFLITKLEKRPRNCVSPSHRGAGRAAAKLQLLPSFSWLFSPQGGGWPCVGPSIPKRALGARGFGRRARGGGRLRQPPKLRLVGGEAAAPQPAFGRGAASPPHPHLPAPLRRVETFSALGPRGANARRRKTSAEGGSRPAGGRFGNFPRQAQRVLRDALNPRRGGLSFRAPRESSARPQDAARANSGSSGRRAPSARGLRFDA